MWRRDHSPDSEPPTTLARNRPKYHVPNIRKPTALKLLAGNPGKRAINKREPKPKGAPVAPNVLPIAALAVWNRLVMAMPSGVYTDADHALLAAYCLAVANWQDVTVALQTAPMLVAGSTGQVVVNPLFKHQEAQAKLMAQLGAQLGLNPAARQSLTVDEPDEVDKFGIH